MATRSLPSSDCGDLRRWAVLDRRTGRIVDIGLRTEVAPVWLETICAEHYAIVQVTMSINGVAIPERGPFHLPGGDQC